jgi:hypothetical protein
LGPVCRGEASISAHSWRSCTQTRTLGRRPRGSPRDTTMSRHQHDIMSRRHRAARSGGGRACSR